VLAGAAGGCWPGRVGGSGQEVGAGEVGEGAVFVGLGVFVAVGSGFLQTTSFWAL
jgi:hypothetical protein